LGEIKFGLDKNKISIGKSIEAEFSFSVKSKNQRLLIDWILFYHREGRDTYKKVFKGKEISQGYLQESIQGERDKLGQGGVFQPQEIIPDEKS